MCYNESCVTGNIKHNHLRMIKRMGDREMHIMLVNDDGIQAPGIRAMCAAAATAGHRVSICAPDGERSAVSHMFSFGRPLHVTRVEVEHAEIAYASDGSPADCARLGLFLIPGVDFVISGINNGENYGGECIYSGTVASATEASMRGVPALAVSYARFNAEQSQYETTARLAMKVVDWMLLHPLPRGAIYSLNVPDLPEAQIRGFRMATLAKFLLDDPLYVQRDGKDGPEYIYATGPEEEDLDPGTDIQLLKSGFATLTPLTWDIRLAGELPSCDDLLL